MYQLGNNRSKNIESMNHRVNVGWSFQWFCFSHESWRLQCFHLVQWACTWWCEGHCHNPSLELVTKAKRSQGHGPRRVWEWRLTLPSELSFWELEFRWSLEPSESDFTGQKTSHWGVLYIIGKILKCKCLKWARMTRLDIWNISYGKKKGRESNW